MKRALFAALVIVTALVFGALIFPVHAVTLEQIISREHPEYNNAAALLSVGEDGRVYLAAKAARGDYNSFVLRVTPDGRDKKAADVGPAGGGNVVANADGVVASIHRHFAAQVRVHDKNFVNIATVGGFTNNDTVGYEDPIRVEAAPSGDFYALGQNQSRVLRIAPQGRTRRAYPYPDEYGFGKNEIIDFRLHEASELFFLKPSRGPLVVIGFDGKERHKINADTGGGWDVGEQGVIFTVGAHNSTIQKYSREGEAAGQIHLTDIGTSLQQHPITGLQIHNGVIFIKRNHPDEMFRRYKISGELINVVSAERQRLTAEFPSLVWTAGQSLPFAIRFDDGGQSTLPRWRVWARRMEWPRYHELPLQNGQVQMPQDWAGLYVLKVSPETQDNDTNSEYLLREVIEVRSPNSRGTVNVLSPNNRVYFGRGEAVPLQVITRAAAQDLPQSVALKLVERTQSGAARVLATEKIGLQNGKAQARLSAALTMTLAPGEYSVEVEMLPGLTAVPQPLIIGPGVPEDEPYLRMLYGDYGGFTPHGMSTSFWSAPEIAAAHVNRHDKLNLNMFVERLGSGGAGMAGAWMWPNTADGIQGVQALKARLEKDPVGVAPEKVEIETPFQQSMAGLSARGMREMSLLVGNDAALPFGTVFDLRTPQQFQEAIRLVNGVMSPYPAFRGWSWAANWWIASDKAFQSPAEKQEYEAALKKARETGEWSEILGAVRERQWKWQTDALTLFNQTLEESGEAKRLVSASAGPYRRPETYPPVLFQNLEEVDLHLQLEQIAIPQWTPHAVDYLKRPGKLAWGHPELFNDSGTGGQILPGLLQMVMRGASGVGQNDKLPNFGSSTTDARSASAGMASVHRTLYGLLERYGIWMRDLSEPSDPIAIVVSRRQMSIEGWEGWGGGVGQNFARQFEAYQGCLYAHRPATFVFSEDLKQKPLTQYKAVLVVGQTVEMEPELKQALNDAKAKGVRVFYDGTSRESLVKEFTPLGIAFDKLDKVHAAQDDHALWIFREAYLSYADALDKALGRDVPALAEVSEPEVVVTERAGGGARYLFAVNNTLPTELSPGQLWRVSMAIANRLPVTAKLQLPNIAGKAVYDVLAMKSIAPQNGVVTADFRSLPMHVFAILPKPIGSVALRGPSTLVAGSKLAWWAQVRDDKGQPLDAELPVRARLLDATGTTLQEAHLSVDKAGLRREWVLPRNVAAGATLEVTELVSGKSARLAIEVSTPSATTFAATVAPSKPSAPTSGVLANTSNEPAEHQFGPRLRDIAITNDGKTAVLNAFEWDNNVYALDTQTGKTLWQRKVGDYFAFAPLAVQGGVAVQGFDFSAAEGYHLYLLDEQGAPQRRFALMGLPSRLTFWSFPSMLQERINNFAASPDGAWFASSGDLGMAAFDRAGKELWAKLWLANARIPAALAAPNPSTLIAAQGATVWSYDPHSGTSKWQLTLAETGEVHEIVVSGDASTLALRTTINDGSVFLIRDGKVLRSLPTSAERLALSADGSFVAVTNGKQLKYYSVKSGFGWSFTGDDQLHFPRIANDGRIVVSSDVGTVYVLDASGEVRHKRDFEALTVPQWLPGGDLLLASWMGKAARLGSDYKAKWSTLLKSSGGDVRGKLVGASRDVATTRTLKWNNAAPVAAPLVPNLLKETRALFSIEVSGSPSGLENDAALLTDGDPAPPPKPWLSWPQVQVAATVPVGIDSSWQSTTALIFDTFRTQVRVKGITFVEDKAHPETWLRNTVLQFWDAENQQWVTSQPLLSDAAVHTHWLDKPVEAARFRLVAPPGHKGWPAGGFRLSEVVLHGEVVGPSHPDVVAKRPVAILFDERNNDLPGFVGGHSPHFEFSDVDTFSGGKKLLLGVEGQVGPPWSPPFAHTIPHWEFEIAENPAPGQYRYLQWAWKAPSEATNSQTLLLNIENPGPGFAFYAGGKPPEAFTAQALKVVQMVERPPRDWKVERVDLWALVQEAKAANRFQGTARIRAMSLVSRGGPAAFDQILLGRTEADLKAALPGDNSR